LNQDPCPFRTDRCRTYEPVYSSRGEILEWREVDDPPPAPPAAQSDATAWFTVYAGLAVAIGALTFVYGVLVVSAVRRALDAL
jgi:hypothetical protein